METQQISPMSMAIAKNRSRAARMFFRIYMKMTGNTRPSSYPYVSGDSFRAIADHIHDETHQLDPELVKLGDTVFVSNPYTLSFLQTVHPKIKYPYILIEHNGDSPIDKTIADLIDDKIVRFYAQDVTYAHPKIIPIPIALENLHFYINGIPRIFKKLEKQITKNPPVRKNKIFFRFSVGTNPAERGPALELFSKNPNMETSRVMLTPIIHLKLLTTYKFVASPPGNAIESCRTWEALALRTVPIVKDFVAMKYFASLGLPIWVLHDWHELDGYTEQMLSDKYAELMKNANFEPLRMDFWINMIKKDQQMTRANKVHV